MSRGPVADIVMSVIRSHYTHQHQLSLAQLYNWYKTIQSDTVQSNNGISKKFISLSVTRKAQKTLKMHL